MQVPYSQFPTAAPQSPGTPSVRVDTPIAAFGGAVAQATEHLGGDIKHAGDELFQRAVALQQLQNETEAKEADAQYMQEAGLLHAQYNSLEGKNAVEAYPKYIKDLEDSRQKIRSGLSTDAARRSYDSSSRSTSSRSIFNGAGHAASQQKRWTQGAIDAQTDMEINGVQNYPNDQNGYDKTISNIKKNAETVAAMHGWDDSQKEEYVKQKSSAALSLRILGMSKTEPLKAYDMFEKNKGQLYGPDALKVETGVYGQMRDMYSRNISNNVLADLHEDPEELGKTRPLAERVNAGVEQAVKEAPNVPGIEDAVRNRIHADYSRIKRITQEDKVANQGVVSDAILGKNNQQGIIPSTMEELRADPKVDAALDKMDSKQIKSVQKALAQNAKGDVLETPERRDRFFELKGLATTDPAKFLDSNIEGEDLPIKDKRTLRQQQINIQKGAQEDPRLTRAMQTMQPDLKAAGIAIRSTDDTYLKFKGQFQMAMEDFISEHKKAPNAEETRAIGARLLRERSEPGMIFGNLWPNKVKFFDQDVPQQVIDTEKARLKERGIEAPSDDQIRRAVVRFRYKELYGGSKPSAPGFVPSAPQSK